MSRQGKKKSKANAKRYALQVNAIKVCLKTRLQDSGGPLRTQINRGSRTLDDILFWKKIHYKTKR